MITEIKNIKWGSDQLWRRIAIVSGVFVMLICVLLIANYLQINKADPVNMTVLDNLADRLKSNPEDAALREEIRMLDLLYRKAYFSSQWQIRTGGYLLLGFVAFLILSLQVLESRKKINPVVNGENIDDAMLQSQKARWGIVLGGGVILATALVFAFLSSNNLENMFTELGNGNEYSLESDINSGDIVVTDLSDETPQNVNETENTSEVVESTQPDTASSQDITTEPSSGNVTESEHEPAPSNAARSRKKLDNFPNFRGIGGVGISLKKNIPINWDAPSGKNVIWKTPIPLPGQNSPIIWGDRIFFTGASEGKQEVYCLDRNTGKLIWTTPVGGSSKVPVVSGETGYAAPTAVTDGTFVYVIFATGDIAAIDFDGKKIWEKDLGMPVNHYGHSSSLMIANGNVIVQYDQRDSQKIMALASHTGETVWSTDRDVKISWTSPIVANTGSRTEIITVAEPYVISYNPNTGKELWKVNCISGEVGPSLAYANGIVFSVNDYSTLAAIKIGDQPKVIWDNNEYLSDIPSPVATDKYLFLATSYGVFLCYDALTGEKYWEHQVGNNVFASPMIVENKIYLLDVTGVMHIYNVDKELKIIAEPVLGEFSASTPVFTDGRIYLKGVQNIYCIGE